VGMGGYEKGVEFTISKSHFSFRIKVFWGYVFISQNKCQLAEENKNEIPRSHVHTTTCCCHYFLVL
jgi:hypothetical protein